MNGTLTKLYALRTRLSDPTRWYKGHGGRSPDRRAACLMHSRGDVGIECGTEPARLLHLSAIRLFSDRGKGCVEINEHRATTHQDILMVIDAAIVAAGGEVPMNHPEHNNYVSGYTTGKVRAVEDAVMADAEKS